ncbi:hypothetical protein [Streptomyces olivaceoviridis]|uniref:hypothetical protein n=1 Tax=Streptomyces olivaceoviridis TaxID=1921 RepID=UPI003700C858
MDAEPGAARGLGDGRTWVGLGLGIVALALLSTGTWAKETAARAAALFGEADRGAAPQPADRR